MRVPHPGAHGTRRTARPPEAGTGDIPEIIGNEENLYEGNLILYFRTLFYNANNLKNPYHNFRHTLHVLWLCQKACRYYQKKKLTTRQMRNLLIAALFHDFDHPAHPYPGEQDPDRINITIAIAGLRRYISADDRASLPEIEALIEATHYPYKTAGQGLDLLGTAAAVVTCRPEFQPPWSGEPHVATLVLNRLDRRDRAALVTQVAGKALPDDVIAQIVERTDGVPLFVEELTKNILEGELLREEAEARYVAVQDWNKLTAIGFSFLYSVTTGVPVFLSVVAGQLADLHRENAIRRRMRQPGFRASWRSRISW
jgi:hypothetical protein